MPYCTQTSIDWIDTEWRKVPPCQTQRIPYGYHPNSNINLINKKCITTISE